MPKRTRMTERRTSEAVDGAEAYPGNVNQPDRKFKTWEQYHNFEQKVNHELPDMRHDWQNDERDEIGFGITEPWGASPTVASVRVAANKSVKLAYFLLGDKVAEDIIEDQANDFMLMGPEALDRALGRFAKTGELYADDDEDEDDEEGDSKEAAFGMDIELSSSVDEADLGEVDSRLASLFDDEIPAELPEPGAARREASVKKKGVKSLGGQPIVAGNGGEAQDISSIWNSAPDVSDVFN